MNTGMRLKWKSDFDKQVIIENFDKRGWMKTQNPDDWNIFWATKESVRMLFNPVTGHRLGDNQLLNHFPNHYELTTKDLLCKNINRYRRDLEKEGNPMAEKDEAGNYKYLDIIPNTYILPGHYESFVEEFMRNPNTTWIAKPSCKSQGQGIFLVKKLNQLKKWASSSKLPFQSIANRENYVISRYIDNPLLVGGKKFDLRIYVLVTCYRPLKAYLYQQGFGRFCTEKYTSDLAKLDDMVIHITNVAYQKHSEGYNDKHGGKWNINNLRLYLEMTRGKEKTEKCFNEMINTIRVSLKAVQSVITNDKHCFEMYGYDILIDANLKPWLIEVNASPSLTTTTESDKNLKMLLLQDTFNIVVPPDWGTDDTKRGANTCKEKSLGYYNLIIDESIQDNKGKGAKKGAFPHLNK